MSDVLLEEEFSSCDGDGPVCRVDQVIDTLAVLGGQDLIRTTAEANTESQSTKALKQLTHTLRIDYG